MRQVPRDASGVQRRGGAIHSLPPPTVIIKPLDSTVSSLTTKITHHTKHVHVYYHAKHVHITTVERLLRRANERVSELTNEWTSKPIHRRMNGPNGPNERPCVTASREAAAALADIEASEGISEMAVALAVTESLPAASGLFIGNSMPIRDIDMLSGIYAHGGGRAGGRSGVGCGPGSGSGPGAPVAANRGASGIDGVVSAAAGYAAGLGQGRSFGPLVHSFVYSSVHSSIHSSGSVGRPSVHTREDSLCSRV